MNRCRLLTIAGALPLLTGLLWLAGFVVFEHSIRRSVPPPAQADAIVALTGGAERVQTALRLLESGHAPLLLISGVGRGADLAELAGRIHLPPDQVARVTVGRAATTTLGNAAETAAWVRLHGVRSLIVVTAGYHMPRALIEIRRALPDLTLYPMPVRPPALRGRMEFATVRMLANEYDKYLAVLLGLSRKNEAEGS